MRLVAAILCFLIGALAFEVAFHPVKGTPTPANVLASLRDDVTGAPKATDTVGTGSGAPSTGTPAAPATAGGGGINIPQTVKNLVELPYTVPDDIIHHILDLF